MLNSTDYFNRQTRAAMRELDDLRGRRFTVRRLSEPLKRGWRRFHVLTPHAEGRRDCDILAAIVKVIGTEVHCRRPDFRVRPNRSRSMVEIEQSVQRLWDYRFEKAGGPAIWRPYFLWRHYSEWGRPRYFGDFRQPALFELRVEPRLVWEVYDVDPEIETRIHELNTWLRCSGGERRYAHLKGQPSAWNKDLPDDRAESLRKETEARMRRAFFDASEADHAALWWSGAASPRASRSCSPK